jgi:hypothetical protein
VRCIQVGPLWLHELASPIEPGVFGSPPSSMWNGTAIGIVSVSAERGMQDHGPNPCLVRNLPGWMLAELSLSPPDVWQPINPEVPAQNLVVSAVRR